MFRKILSGEEGGLGLGSDGETSDYQRSTPSPGDSNDRITEVTEGKRLSEIYFTSLRLFYYFRLREGGHTEGGLPRVPLRPRVCGLSSLL